MATCSFDGCDREAVAKGYCRRHYYYQKRHGAVAGPTCSVEGCGKPLYGNGLCNMHNLRSKRHDDPHAHLRATNNEACTRACATEGCGRLAVCKGYCNTHYYYQRRHGKLPCPTCVVEGCNRPASKRKMCNMHALREEHTGDPLARKRAANGEVQGKPCSVDGCSNPARGTFAGAVYCMTHFCRVKRHGDPHTRKKLANGESTPERRKEVARRAMDRYHQTPHGRLRARFSAAKKRVLEGSSKGVGTITKEQFLELWHSEPCWICGLPMGDNWSLDHVVPVSKGGNNTLDNLRMAHLRCNQRKTNKLLPAEVTEARTAKELPRIALERKCSVVGCGGKHLSRDLCRKHYLEQRRAGKFSSARCSVAGCGLPVNAKGLCNKHRIRLTKYGDVHCTKLVRPATPERRKLLQAARMERYLQKRSSKKKGDLCTPNSATTTVPDA